MTISFIDVGQGDSELVQTPSGKVILIDAGPTGSGSKVVEYLQDLGISTIDVIVATHPHQDHIGGMAAVLNAFTVKQFVDSGYPQTTSTYENMLNLIYEKNIPFQTVKIGDTIALDPAVSVQVLNPQDNFSDDINQNSVILKIIHGKTTFLFAGDADGISDHADILKVPHHGSDIDAGTITQIAPAVSIIEVGTGNSYGYPTASTLQRLQQEGSAIYRTDFDGTIKITSDGITYSVDKENRAAIAAGPTIKVTTVPQISDITAVCDCLFNRYNCADFSTQAAAQACYNYCIAQGNGDIHGLDNDKNGQACGSNKQM
ncbi:MAG: MBL fold metallo-hydrolase [Methanoregula sp.]|nr:MBL fold metallo-hydrolase [Methanoregula sp.]